QPPRASEVAPKPRRAQLRGDLDNILQKALAKDRDDRYADVGELARDLRRHLDDEPIEVTAPTTWYRLRKFVRRNRAQSLAFAIAGLLVLVTLLLLAVALRRVQHEARLKQQALQALREKADAGFRLLANEDRIDAARRAERELPPPWPQHLERYRAWQRSFADLLFDSRTKVTARLAALATQRERDGGVLRDEADRHLERALTRLGRELDRFLGHGGLAEEVAARLAWGERHAATPPPEFAATWQRAREQIRASNGESAARAYAGLQLPVLPGLLPLGCHPRTKLWEFLDLRTHRDGHPLPARDAASGDLVCDGDTGVVFVLLPAARVTVGARRNQPGMERNDDLALADEQNDATVTLDAFLIARTELTVGQYARLTGHDLADFDPRLPMSNVDWSTFCNQLRRFGMALPTEVQWEYACRAGTTTPWCWGDDPEPAPAFGWFEGQLRPVGELRTNRFGLCDVHGNAAEWCLDEKLPYDAFPARNGDGLRARPQPREGARRVVRGGSIATGVIRARSTARDRRPPDTRDGAIGVRPARAISR
ncbi:MAG TPA: hypothetical protein ENI87_00920, partial [bacterium]|nr:hypothetical protein [bacterium]